MNSSPYSACNKYLAQGDLFVNRVIAPYVDREIRIFRANNGRHGSYVLSGEESNGRLYSYDDLVEIIASLPEAERIMPFHGRNSEMVIVYADLIDYFVIASQTCDVSGVDRKAFPFAVIVPFITVGQFLARERIPIGLDEDKINDETKWTTIVDFLDRTLNANLRQWSNNPFELPDKVRETIRNWKPGKKDIEEKNCKSAIVNFIDKSLRADKSYVFYLPKDVTNEIPEGYIDFCRTYSVSTVTLDDYKENRKATLSISYRDAFGHKLGVFFSRVATPVHHTPPPLK